MQLQTRFFFAVLTLALTNAFRAPAATNLSAWVYPGSSGRLLSRPDFQGNRIPDSSGVGYRSGIVPLPSGSVVPVRTNVLPVLGDNTANIQSAINYVSGLPFDA